MAKIWTFIVVLVCCEVINGKKECPHVVNSCANLGTTKDDNCHKLGLHKLYDFIEGGTDSFDQRMGLHTTKTKSRKWTLVMFAYMLDTARVNSSTIFPLNQGKDPIKEKSFEYTYQLVMKLVKPTTEMWNQVFLASKIKQKIALVLDRLVPQPEPHRNDGFALGGTLKGCTMCQKAAAGKDYSEKKVLFSMSRHFGSLAVMDICFKNALAVPITMQYNMAVF